ncbi:MAG: circadian clock protein KaiC, partial [Thermodesulfobacteriota bacterium]
IEVEDIDMSQDFTSRNEKTDPPHAITKVPTGIVGLDEVLQGGIPEGGLTLLSGGPGSGKTMLGLAFLVRSAQAGRPGILLTFEERKRDLRNYAFGFGWDLPLLEKRQSLAIISARMPPNALLSGDFDLRGLLGIVQQQAQQMEARHILIDAPDVFLRLLENTVKERAELQALYEWLRNANLTCILTAKRQGKSVFASYYEFLDYMAECVIHLNQDVSEQIATRRLRIIKYRGSTYGRNEYPFAITSEGLRIIPVTQTSLEHQALGESLPSGIEGMDEILGGGFRRNSCTLITGGSGTGKTTFACSFALAATSSGERVIYLDFEESWEALLSCMQSVGLDLRQAFDSGKLRFFSSMPESKGVEEHLIQAFRAVEDCEPQHLVVDAISACRRMGSEHAAFDYLLRLIDFCKKRGITTLLTNLTASDAGSGQEITGLDLSSVIDTVIILSNVQDQKRFKRKLRVFKSRGRGHSNRIHEFKIKEQGIRICPGE